MPFHLADGMRAGDLKLMAAAGAFLGLNTIIAVGFSLMLGAVAGLLVLVWRDGLNAYLNRYTTMLAEFAGTGRLHYTPPEKNEAAASSFPYAVAIAAGCLATLQSSWY